MWKWLFLAFAFATPVFADACHVQSDISGVTPSGWTDEMNGRAPLYNSETGYQYYTQNKSISLYLDGDVTSTETLSQVVHSIWRPRYDGSGVTKPNPLEPQVILPSGQHCGVVYDTLGRADAAGASYVAYTIGRGPTEPHGAPFHNGWQDAINYYDPAPTQQLTTMTHAQFVANEVTLCANTDASSGWAYATNVVVFPDVRLVDIPTPKYGISIDDETHQCDSSCIPDTNTWYSWVVADVHQKRDPSGNPYNFKVDIYTNPFDNTAFYKNGLDPNSACLIVDQCDLYTFAGGGPAATQMAAELALVPSVPTSRLYWLIDMQETPAEIATARTLAVSSGLSGVSFFYDGIAPCSTQWNAVLAAALGL